MPVLFTIPHCTPTIPHCHIALTLLNCFGINYEINYTYTYTLDCFWITSVIISARRVFLVRGDHPNSWKNAPRMQGQMKIFRAGSRQFRGIAPRVAPRIVGFVLIKSWEAIPRMEFRIPRMEFPIPRAAPRIPRNSPRAPRMAFSLRERFSWNWGGPQASE